MGLLIRITLLTALFASVATMVILRTPGDATVAEGGRYYVHHKGARHEIGRDRYEENETLAWRGRATGVAAVTMFASLFLFVGFESIRFGRRRVR